MLLGAVIQGGVIDRQVLYLDNGAGQTAYVSCSRIVSHRH